MAFQSNGVDFTSSLVPKSYVLDIYPSLSNVITTPSLWSCGYNTFGQLGDNTITHKSSPVQTIAGGSNWKMVANGGNHTAAIKTDGTLWVCGYNTYGQIGDNTSTHKSSPVQTIAGGSNWKMVTNGNFHTTAIKTDGTLWSWGHNTYGQLGDSTITHKSSPVQTIAGGTNWKMVVNGYYHTAAIKNDGTLWVWGRNDRGQLGDNTRVNKSSPIQTIAGGTNWKMVTSGVYHTTAIKNDGTLWLWGRNDLGQLGDNTSANKSSPVQTIAGGTNWKIVANGGNHTAAIKTDGTLWVCGYNTYGQIGDNTSTHKSSPVQTIAGGTNWKTVANGNIHTAAIKTDGTLWTWGKNDSGQLGDNTITHKSSPVQTIAGGTNWTQIRCGLSHTIAITDNDALGDARNPITSVTISGATTVITGNSYVYTALINYLAGPSSTDCTKLSWSTNGSGTTGSSTILNVNTNGITISMDNDGTNTIVAQDYNSAFNSTLSLTEQPYYGSLWGWGSDSYGQLGDGSTVNKSSPIQTISSGSNWKQISNLKASVCGVKTDGTLWCWGYNYAGVIGDNSTISKSSPVQTAAGGTNWKQASAGALHAGAIKNDGTLWCWGNNGFGQLGDSSITSKSSPVQTSAGGTNWKQVACGYYHTAAIKSNGTLWTWGYNSDGALGDNTRVDKSSPIQTVAGGIDWVQVAAGWNSTAAVKTDGTLWLWGRNNTGQLGDSTITYRSSPVQTTAGGTNWKQVTFGWYHTLAVKKDGTLWCWGSNNSGQLGDNTLVDKSSPVQTVAGGTNWRQATGSHSHSAAIKTDGTVWLWGSNGNGQLGDGTTISKSSPIQLVSSGTSWKQVASGNNYTAVIADQTAPYISNVAISGTTSTSMLSSYTYTALISYTDGSTSTDCTKLNWVTGNGTGSSTIMSVSSSGVDVSMDLDGTDTITAKSGNITGTLPVTIANSISASLWVCGYNYYGQLGDNTTTPKSSPVQTVAGGTNWSQIAVGDYHTAAIKTDGTLWGWGYGGGIGDNTGVSKSSPVQTITGGTNWKYVTCGSWHTAAIKTDGTLWLWGGNTYGTLGNSANTNLNSPVQTVAGGTNWKMVRGGNAHTVAIKTDGTLWAWGYNANGMLGDNSIVSKSSPVQVYGGGTNWKQVACGAMHTLAIKSDGTMWGWGRNNYGQLGDGTQTHCSSPVQVSGGGTNWKQVTCCGYASVAIKTDGTMWAWGMNSYGLVTGSSASGAVTVPTQDITLSTNWKSVTVSQSKRYLTAAIKSDGTLWTWGYNNPGGLGDNTSVSKSSPVQTVAGGNNWKQVACAYHTVALR